MTAVELSAIAGVVLSLVLEYVPGVAGWYGKLEATKKRLTVLGLLFVTAGVAYGLSCVAVLDKFVCSGGGAWEAFLVFIAAVVANQAIHLVVKRG